jgi:hypothetical protein
LVSSVSTFLLLPALGVLNLENFSNDWLITDTGNRIKKLESGNLWNTVKDTNKKISLLKEENKDKLKITELVRVVVSHVNPKVTIKNINFDRTAVPGENKTMAIMRISGNAKDRDGYLAFLWALEKETNYFTKVESPITNLIKSKDLSFQLNLTGIKY